MKEQILFCRYDLDDIATEQDARNLCAGIYASLSPVCNKVIYRKTEAYEMHRTQTKFYDIDETIKHYEDKINGTDKRFMKSRKRYLKVLLELRELKIKEVVKNESNL